MTLPAPQILQDAVRYRWKTLPQSQRDAIKTYLVRKIVEVRRPGDRRPPLPVALTPAPLPQLAKDDATLQGQKLFVSQMNQTLVEARARATAAAPPDDHGPRFLPRSC